MYNLIIIVRYLSYSQVFRTFLNVRLIVLYNNERYDVAKKVHYVLDLVLNTNEAQRA